jgi:hypothetical protein
MRFNEQHMHHQRKRFHHLKYLLGILVFILVVGGILFTTVYDGKLITGDIVRNLNLNNSFEISSETNIPNLKISGNYEEISIGLLPGQEIILGNKKISLEKEANSLVLREFSGEISFNENYMSILKGKVSEAYINGILIKEESDKQMKISPVYELKYKSLEIKEINLKELNFVCSGIVNIEGDTYNLEEEKLIIKNLLGNIQILEKKLSLDGIVESLEIRSDKRSVQYTK